LRLLQAWRVADGITVQVGRVVGMRRSARVRAGGGLQVSVGDDRSAQDTYEKPDP